MASWEHSFKKSYKESHSHFVTLPSPAKNNNDENEDVDFEESENEDDASSKKAPEGQNKLCVNGAVRKTAKNFRHRDDSLPPIELNCRLKFKKSSVLSSDGQSETDDDKYELLPHFSLVGHSQNADHQQCISKDMLCTVVKDMELSSKSSEYDYSADLSENIETILQDLSEDNIEVRCISVLNFAKRCLSEEFRSQLDEADILSLMLKTLPDVLSFNDFAFCCSVLLCVLSQYPRNRDNKRLMESILLQFLQTTTSRKKSDVFSMSSNDIGGYDIRSLPENIMKKSLELCKLLSICNDWELQGINILFLNCISAKFIFSHSSKGGQRNNNPDILCSMIDKIHEGVQQLSLKKQVCFAESSEYHSNLRMISKCLQVLEPASFLHPETQKYLVTCQNSAISRDSNRLLGFCMKYLFYDGLPQSLDVQMPENEMNYDKEVHFYIRSCLVSNLKVLLNLSYKCKEAVIKLGAMDGLMEKVLMCILNVASQKSEEQFEVLILCLELLINLIEPCWSNRKTFAILCLKKFPVSADSNLFAVEHLIEMLVEILKEISLLERLKDEATNDTTDDSAKTDEAEKKSDDVKADIVFKAAGKHMEQSMICAYISILLGFFVDIKRTFRDLVHDKMPPETIEQAVLVSKKFLSFVKLTEGPTQNSIKSLNAMLSTLHSVNDGR